MINLMQGHVIANDLFLSLQLLKKLGYAPDLVFDIGAYKGEWTKKAFNIFPSAQFLMIEAQDDKEHFLQKTTQSNRAITYRIGLLGSSSSKEFPFYKMETGSSIYSEQSTVPRDLIKLAMRTLDEVAPSLQENQTAFLKLDVQGAELDILEGAPKTLERVDVILMEASVVSCNKNAPLIGDVFKKMEELGFILFDICEQKRTENSLLIQVDLLFIRKNSALIKKQY